MSTPALADDLLLPRPPGLFRRLLARPSLLVDAVVALPVLGIEYLDALSGDGLGFQGDLLLHGTWPLVLIGCAGLLLRRRQPLVALAVIAAFGVTLTLLGQPYLLVAASFAVYAAAVYRSPRLAWLGLAGTVVLFIAATSAAHLIMHDRSFWSGLQGTIGLTLFLAIAALIGVNIGDRKRYLDALLERAAQLARERDQQGQLAAAAERSRIAREMHDVVAHSLSVVVRLADGADAIADADPEKSRETVRQIGEVGRESLRDMRRLLGVLRDDSSAELAPQPSLDELDRLIETYRSAGLPVAVQRTGDAPSDVALQVAVYRAVQESLTNALRYATEPSRVLVQLAFEPESSTVDVTDDGIFVGAKPSVGTGSGLVGLRERAAVFGGTVEAGSTRWDGAGWRVRMTLHHPREDSP
ncbi:putative secreted protein with PEP-CTERM sorting signal [Frondihabitans sp. PhB188]|uniref:sensor histidine kinase n=1 Tax=Frondihabitans sp. PhB188 TaxID=2485200 RepID=UPI000F49FB00|nr:histidine kinase [Frondihabitans sp. PhB188]ROQ40054.1 putative secreted protein with PEP-CTERM sorting signal [Frondihabitans sp. PhB188]